MEVLLAGLGIFLLVLAAGGWVADRLDDAHRDSERRNMAHPDWRR